MTDPTEPMIPRHIRAAIRNAQQAFARDDLAALATVNEHLQPLVDAAVAAVRRAEQRRDVERAVKAVAMDLGEQVVAERDRLARILAVEEGITAQACEGWRHDWLFGWLGRQGRRITGHTGDYKVVDAQGKPILGTRRRYVLESMEAAADPAHGLIAEAEAFARHAHRDHRRKYTGEPYAVHLAAVALTVSEVTTDPEAIAAAWLHDSVEDVGVTLAEIRDQFGHKVAEYVGWLTDVSRPSDGNRAARKAIDRAHLAEAPDIVQTIKLADLIDNTRDIMENDPKFARVYINEKRLLLQVLTRGDPGLLQRAALLVSD